MNIYFTAYDHVPDINNLFSYLFNENLKFKILKLKEDKTIEDSFENQKSFIKKNYFITLIN